MVEEVIWRFKKYAHFGFIIPDNREMHGWDYFVTWKNSKDAKDWDLVTWHILSKQKGKKPEAKIVHVWKPKVKKAENIVWIYSEHKWSFWFVDLEWEGKWVFVFKKDNLNAKDWDKVEAKIKIFKWKKEAVIIKIFKNDSPIIEWEYKDMWGFWFVLPVKWKYNKDIFVAWAKKANAKDWDIVWVQIIKENWRRPEWIIRKIL